MCKFLSSSIVLLVCTCAMGRTVSTVEELASAVTAINNGASDKTITLNPGTYDLSSLSQDTSACLWVTKSECHFVGSEATSWRASADKNTAVILDAGSSGRAVIGFPNTLSIPASKVTFRNITFANGQKQGVAHKGYAGQIIYENCVFRNNSTPSNGPAGGNGGAAAGGVFTECYFTNNVCVTSGGAIYYGAATNCVFEFNKATSNWSGSGGACGADVTRVKGCVFRGNSAYGGAAIGGNGLRSCVDCDFIENVAHGNWIVANPQVSNSKTDEQNLPNMVEYIRCTFTGNKKELNGANDAGQFYVLKYPKLVSECSFTGNEVHFGGSLIFPYKAITTIEKCGFTNNVTDNVSKTANAVSAGCVCPTDGWSARPLVFECNFYSNSCINGGAVCNAIVSNCTFELCYGKDTAGGVSSSKVYNSHFTDCRSLYGSGAASGGLLEDCVIEGCKGLGASQHIGGASDATCVRTTFRDCSAGADTNLFKYATQNCIHSNCTFLGNGAYLQKASVRTRFQNFTCTNGKIKKEGAVVSGGIMENCLVTGCNAWTLLSNVSNLLNCTIANNNLNMPQMYASSAVSHTMYNDFASGYNSSTSTVVNCIFRNNKFKKADNDFYSARGTYVLENCAFGDCYSVADDEANRVFTVEPINRVQNNLQNLFRKPLQRGYDENHPYQLAPNSPARNKGASIAWAPDETDLMGNARVYLKDGGGVDMGCYEYSLEQLGTMLIFK